MNIFVTSDCPKKAAKYLDDKRKIKMCLETAQMLSTSLRATGYVSNKIYKTAHLNHPCSIWARQTRSNFLWLCEHGLALCNEYTKIYGKIHKSQKVIELCKDLAHFIPQGERTPFANCAANLKLGISYKDMEDTVAAYQLYLNDRWSRDKREPTWYGVK